MLLLLHHGGDTCVACADIVVSRHPRHSEGAKKKSQLLQRLEEKDACLNSHRESFCPMV